jgi:folate-binding protein YgfZ
MEQLSFLSVARLTGRDAARFLHAQMSADISVLKDGEATYTCYCNPRGQVIAVLLIARLGEAYMAIAGADLMPAVLQKLKLYVLREDVSIETLDAVAVWGLSGSQKLPAGLTKLAPPSVDLRYAVGPKAGIDGREPPGDWRYREIQAGIAWLDIHSSEKFLPQMLGLDQLGAVSFSKGCYPGQEIIARTKYLGKLKRFRAIMHLTSDPGFSSGEKVNLVQGESQAEGIVIDHATAPDGETVVLAVARHDPDRPIDRLIAGDRQLDVVKK